MKKIKIIQVIYSKGLFYVPLKCPLFYVKMSCHSAHMSSAGLISGMGVDAPVVKVDAIDVTKLNVSWTIPKGALAKEVSF